jgi:hypothetical protein
LYGVQITFSGWTTAGPSDRTALRLCQMDICQDFVDEEDAIRCGRRMRWSCIWYDLGYSAPRRRFGAIGKGSSGLKSSLCPDSDRHSWKTHLLKPSIEYIRDHVKAEENAYILALAANALASWDAKDDSTHEVLTKLLHKLDSKKTDVPEWQAINFAAGGQSLAYAAGS